MIGTVLGNSNSLVSKVWADIIYLTRADIQFGKLLLQGSTVKIGFRSVNFGKDAWLGDRSLEEEFIQKEKNYL